MKQHLIQMCVFYLYRGVMLFIVCHVSDLKGILNYRVLFGLKNDSEICILYVYCKATKDPFNLKVFLKLKKCVYSMH